MVPIKIRCTVADSWWWYCTSGCPKEISFRMRGEIYANPYSEWHACKHLLQTLFLVGKTSLTTHVWPTLSVLQRSHCLPMLIGMKCWFKSNDGFHFHQHHFLCCTDYSMEQQTKVQHVMNYRPCLICEIIIMEQQAIMDHKAACKTNVQSFLCPFKFWRQCAKIIIPKRW